MTTSIARKPVTKLLARTPALIAFGLLFLLSASPVLAQWQWLDKDGRKVFSDRSPPADILEKNILKRPGGAPAPIAAQENPGAGTATGASNPPANGASAALAAGIAKKAASAPVLTGKDAQLEARKKQAEDEEAAKKKADAEKVAAARADNCSRAKRAVAGLESGVRMATTNAKGEREIMDDKARAAETKRLQEVVASDCAVQ